MFKGNDVNGFWDGYSLWALLTQSAPGGHCAPHLCHKKNRQKYLFYLIIDFVIRGEGARQPLSFLQILFSPTNTDDFLENFPKGWGGQFQSEIFVADFKPFYRDLFGRSPKKCNIIFRKWRGRSQRPFVFFPENSSVLVAWPVSIPPKFEE